MSVESTHCPDVRGEKLPPKAFYNALAKVAPRKDVESAEPEIQDETLNVDVLKKILNTHLPIKNRGYNEEYSKLIQNLSNCEIRKSSELISLIQEQLDKALHEDEKQVLLLKAGASPQVATNYEWERAYEKDVYYSHSQLIRVMLSNKFGDRWKLKQLPDSIKRKIPRKKKSHNITKKQ